MSNYQPDSGNFTSRTDNYNRREGFNDDQGGVESYGAGGGSGAYDLANTGLGGYGNGNGRGGFEGPDTFTGTSGGFKNQPKWSSNVTSEGTGAERDEGFADGSVGTGGGSYGSGPGAGATDPANTGLGGYSGPQSSNQPTGNTARATSDMDEFNAQMDSAFSQGERERECQGGQPTMSDRLRGTAEKMTGQIMGDTDMQMRGERRTDSDQC